MFCWCLSIESPALKQACQEHASHFLSRTCNLQQQQTQSGNIRPNSRSVYCQMHSITGEALLYTKLSECFVGFKSASMTGNCYAAGSSQEHMLQHLINGLTDKHSGARSRKLAAHAPVTAPVCPQVQAQHLLHADQDHTRSTPCKHPNRLLVTFLLDILGEASQKRRTTHHKWLL